MRQYRGMTKDGKWVYGGLVYIGEHCLIIDGGYTLHEGLKLIDYVFNHIEVLPKTVGQSTGLKDKDGKEIYENDRVKIKCWEEETTHIIKWWSDHQYPAFDLYPHIDCESNGIAYALIEADWSIEIIGNIHDKEQK